MKNKRTTIAVILLAALLTCLCFIFPVAASDNSSIALQSVTAQAGETVNIQIVMNKNAGIIGMTLDVDYNSSAMTLVQVIDGGILGTNAHKPELSNPYTLSWSNDTSKTNICTDGVIATLRFSINSDTPDGFYPVTVRYAYDNYDIYNSDICPVKFNLIAGGVTVTSSAHQNNFLLGDADGDNDVTISDVTTIQRYLVGIPICTTSVETAGDIDGDGINISDATLIQRYLVGFSVDYPINSMVKNV